MSDFLQPPRLNNPQGEQRRVGYELEYAGVNLSTSAALLEDILDCQARQSANFCYELDSPDYGTFKVEVDAALLQDGKYQEYLDRMGISGKQADSLDRLVESLASTLVPCEIVTPPLPLDAMPLVDEMVDGLRRQGAKGTGMSPLYAFGLHLNPEVASLDVSYLLAHVQAFALLFDWISLESQVDLTRRLSPYIKPYPEAYLQRLLNPDYAPDPARFIADYLELVGSRNHALDMLPILAELDPETVRRQAREPDLVKPRPAFHYRLANSHVDQREWWVATEWRYWVEVERLADDEARLKQWCQDYRAMRDDTMLGFQKQWAGHVAGQLATAHQDGA